MSLIYLASPYSHESHIIRSGRVEATRQFVAVEMKKGNALLSPVLYGHQFVPYGFGTDDLAWRFLNEELMARCDACWVLQLAGWQQSKGVKREIGWFEFRGFPVEYKQPIELPRMVERD